MMPIFVFLLVFLPSFLPSFISLLHSFLSSFLPFLLPLIFHFFVALFLPQPFLICGLLYFILPLCSSSSYILSISDLPPTFLIPLHLSLPLFKSFPCLSPLLFPSSFLFSSPLSLFLSVSSCSFHRYLTDPKHENHHN